MDDLISRQAVLDAITESINQFGGRYTAEQLNMWGLFTQMVQELPSAEPERKRGRWINAECKDGTIAHKCSECKCLVGYSVSSLTWFNFCPWCGADMRGGEERMDRDEVVKRFWELDIEFTPKQITALKNLLAEDETHEKRGKWIKTRHGYMNGMPIYKCSNCTNFRLSREDGDMIEHYYFTAQFPYCPCCGSKMEQEERK